MGQLYDFWQVAVLLFRGHCGFGLETLIEMGRWQVASSDQEGILYVYIIFKYILYVYIKDHVYVNIDVLAYLTTGWLCGVWPVMNKHKKQQTWELEAKLDDITITPELARNGRGVGYRWGSRLTLSCLIPARALGPEHKSGVNDANYCGKSPLPPSKSGVEF